MNVLIITDYFDVGGNATYIINVCKTLESLGHSVKLITFKSSQNIIQYRLSRNNHYNVNINDFQIRFFPSRIFRLHKLLSKLIHSWKPDLVISDLCLPAGAFQVCRIFFPGLRSAPFLFHFLGSNTLEKKSGIEYRERHHGIFHAIKRNIHIYILRTFEKLVLNQTTAIVIMSDYSRKLLDAIGVKNTVYKILPGCENIFRNFSKKLSKLMARQMCSFTQHKKMVLIISRLEPRKGILHILDTLAAHRLFLTNTLVVLCSQFESYFGIDVLKDHSIHKFSKNVVLINNPTLKDKALLYRASDVVIIPSLDLETFGFVALEAYATGTPVVAYNVGAFNELIDHDWLITPVGDGGKLLRKTKQLLSISKAKQNKMSKYLVKYSKKFSWKTYTKKIINIALSLQSTK